MQQLRKRWWLIPIALPFLTYAGLIIAAYISPPLRISGGSTGLIPQPAAVIALRNESRWPVTLMGVAVKGVLPPDEVGAMVNEGGELAQVYSLMHPAATKATGDLVGWQVSPWERGVSHGVKLIWYQNADLRWLDCPVVYYRYLGWPMTARGFCLEALRVAASHGGALPAGLGEWGPWQSVAGGVRYRTQRLVQERGDELWIEVEPDEGAPRVFVTLNRFAEEPGGGRARFRMRMVTIDDSPAATMHFVVPLRWGEPTPEIVMEAIPVSELR